VKAMPLGRLIKRAISPTGAQVLLSQACVVVKEGNRWTVLDPENNNELVRGATTEFLRKEIAAQRLEIEKGWDHGRDMVADK